MTARRLLPLLLALCASAVAAQFPVVELSAGMHRIEAEFANDMGTRARGLMHRPGGEGETCDP